LGWGHFGDLAKVLEGTALCLSIYLDALRSKIIHLDLRKK